MSHMYFVAFAKGARGAGEPELSPDSCFFFGERSMHGKNSETFYRTRFPFHSVGVRHRETHHLITSADADDYFTGGCRLPNRAIQALLTDIEQIGDRVFAARRTIMSA